MPEALARLLAPLAGLALGVVFFGGLWWTAQRVAHFRHAALAVISSLLLRMGLSLAGFYLVADGHWQRLLLCLLGFLVARGAVSWLTRLAPPEAPHAP